MHSKFSLLSENALCETGNEATFYGVEYYNTVSGTSKIFNQLSTNRQRVCSLIELCMSSSVDEDTIEDIVYDFICEEY